MRSRIRGGSERAEVDAHSLVEVGHSCASTSGLPVAGELHRQDQYRQCELDLHLHGTQFNAALAVFYVSYILVELRMLVHPCFHMF